MYIYIDVAQHSVPFHCIYNFYIYTSSSSTNIIIIIPINERLNDCCRCIFIYEKHINTYEYLYIVYYAVCTTQFVCLKYFHYSVWLLTFLYIHNNDAMRLCPCIRVFLLIHTAHTAAFVLIYCALCLYGYKGAITSESSGGQHG